MAKRKAEAKRRQVKLFHCSNCPGWRPHLIERIKDSNTGRARRVINCQICGHQSPMPGINCDVCGENKFATVTVRHPRPGMTIRLKRCQAKFLGKVCGAPKRMIEREAFERDATMEPTTC